METKQPGRILIGKGALNWPKRERLTRRYGTVTLIDRDSMNQKITENAFLDLDTINKYSGKYGRLFCEVLEVRQSSQADYRRIVPTTPAVGDIILLGTGKLFIENMYGVNSVGLVGEGPFGWLNQKSLHRVHEQTVNLYFEPISKK